MGSHQDDHGGHRPRTQAGKAKSTLYYYYKSKNEVLEAMAQAQLDRIIGLAKEEIAGKKTAKEQLMAYLLTIFREVRELMAPLNLERDMASIRAVVDRAMEKFDALNDKVVEPILRSGLERGEFGASAPGIWPSPRWLSARSSRA